MKRHRQNHQIYNPTYLFLHRQSFASQPDESFASQPDKKQLYKVKSKKIRNKARISKKSAKSRIFSAT